MARRIFFSFHYDNDIWRASTVRNSWMVKPESRDDVFYDASLWEEAKKTGDTAIQRLIQDGLRNTSVTAVLIGSETATRRWVRYEIEQSLVQGKGLLGIYIHNLKDQRQQTVTQGRNPFDDVNELVNGYRRPLSARIATYDWVFSDGYKNLPAWAELAARQAGR